MPIKRLAFAFIVSVVLSIAISPLRSQLGLDYSTLVGGILYFGLTFVLVRSSDRRGVNAPAPFILLTIIVGLWLLQTPIRIMNFSATLISLPEAVAETIGIICGFAFARYRTRIRFVFVGLLLFVCIFMFAKGYDLWLHKLNYGTFNGQFSISSTPKFLGRDRLNNIVASEAFGGRVTILDFWHTRCGICFSKFPILEDAHVKHWGNPRVAFYAVNKPIDEDLPNQAFEVIEQRGYSFPVLIPYDANLPEEWGVSLYPTTFVVGDDGKILYKGDIEGAVSLTEELLKSN